MNVYYLGPRQTFSEKAAHTLAAALPGVAELVSVRSFEAVALAVAGEGAAGAGHAGVLPYYNFLEGLIQESLDLIVEYRLRIVDACRLPIVFALGGWPETDAAIYSHPKALAQCSDYLREYYPAARLETVASTADAPAIVARTRVGCAISAPSALENAGLPVLATDIANRRHGKANFTEFLLLVGEDVAAPGSRPDAPQRTMVAIAPDLDEPGLLAVILGQFAFHRINIAKIHSRPRFLADAGDTEPQMFYLELACPIDSPALGLCVESLRHRFGRAEAIRLLGQFPRLNS